MCVTGQSALQPPLEYYLSSFDFSLPLCKGTLFSVIIIAPTSTIKYDDSICLIFSPSKAASLTFSSHVLYLTISVHPSCLIMTSLKFPVLQRKCLGTLTLAFPSRNCVNNMSYKNIKVTIIKLKSYHQ